MIKTFEALANLPFGINRGDIITVENGVARKRDYTPSVYKPEKEPQFFKEVVLVDAKFAKGDKVMLMHKYRAPNTAKSQPSVPPFAELSIHDVKESGIGSSRVVKYTLYHSDTMQKFEVEEARLALYEPYYFFSSSGSIQSAPAGQDKQADTFRKLMGNYFSDRAAINNFRDLILGGKAKLTENII